MSDPPPPLDPELAELLRDEGLPPAGVRPRARARLAAALPGVLAASAPPVHANTGAAAGSASGAGAVSSALRMKGVAAVAFVLGGAAGAGLHAAIATPPMPRVVYVTTPATNAASPPPRTTTAPTSAQSSESVSAPEAPPPMAAPVESSPRTSQLTIERSLLDDVRAALVRGDANAALEGLRSSRQKFGHAILAEEREALGVEALVAAGRYAEARAAATQFKERFPSSLFSGAVEGSIRSIP